MKLIDYIYYARKINKANNKESKTIRFGLFFSMFLILIFGLFYLWISSISSSINNEKTVSSIHCSYVKYGEEKPDVYGYEEILHKGVYGVTFNNPTSSKIDYPTISIDNIDYKISSEMIDKYKINVAHFFTYYDNKENEKLYLDSERDYLANHGYGDVIVAGQSFTNNKYEIMVSNSFLDALGISDYNSVIGKQISYKVLFNTGYNPKNNHYQSKVLINEGNECVDISEEFIDYEYYVFENFKIVGVFNSMIDYCYTRNIPPYSPDNFMYAFWIKYSDINPICYEHGSEHIGEFVWEDNNYIFDTNPKEIINNSKGINIIRLNNSHKYSYNSAVLQFKDAESAYNYYNDIVNQYGSRSIDCNKSLRVFFELYPYYSFVRSLLIILITCSILISLLNVIRLIDYSINKSRDFNIMLENLGLKEKKVYLIYYFRMIYEYIKASILMLIIDVPLCILHYIVFEKVFGSNNYKGIIDFKIPIYGYFIVFFISFLIVYFMISISVFIVYLINMNKLKGVIKND